MRVTLFSLLFFMFSATSYAQVPSKPSVNERVFDYANVIDDEIEQEMRALIQQVENETTNQIVLMTIETIGDMEAFEFGTEVIRQWGIGQAGVNNGMLIYTTTEQGEGNNDVWISVGQGLGEQFPDGKLGRIIDTYMMDSLVAGDFTAAFSDTLSIIGQEMLGEIEDSDPYEDDSWFWGIVFILVMLFMGWVIFWLGPKYGGGSGDSSDGYSGDSGGSSGSDFGGGSSDGGGAGRSF